MQAFFYVGRNKQGDEVKGKIEASDEGAAVKLLRAQHITPIDIGTKTQKKAAVTSGTKNADVNFLTPSVKLGDLIIFCRQMYSLTKSGIPIIRSVAGLATTKSLRLQHALKDVVEHLEKGRNLSSALSQHPKIFGQLFVSIVHVGENTGQLDSAFLQLALYLEREQETRKQIKSATRYPSFVIMALAAAFIVMNIFVIPVFANMFTKFNSELPLMTQILLGTSDFILNQWYILASILLVCIFITKQYINTQNGRINWDHWKIQAPVVGDIVERSLLGRFARSFSMMLRSGVPLTSALSLVADAMDNAYMGDRILLMRRSIEKGESLSRVAKSSGLFTPLVLQMIAVGEETGRVEELLAEVADFYEREVEYDIKTLTSKIEPILISVVAVMVLILALGIFTPMWDMMGAIR
ncbi:type II secretion system F family protein [Agaribacter marinus]|uniref:MSHA biogenesis protein MshG n=1 Tax=Agaribacter marinus TaxID=1431249 RepID=A0AA37SYC9_9ALTE|nr:type II secretion system F family protein [Agaribacter marinus]GLR72237.1 MSHA biogenesis protein MshG [Agaribacter marinus]